MKKFLALILAAAMMISAVSAFADSAIDTIMTAGTTQAFTDEAVSEDDLNTIMQAGLATASAINQQPWYFVAVTGKEIVAELTSGGSAMGSAPAGASAPAAAAGDGASSGAPAGDGASSGAPAASASAKAGFGDSPAAIIIYMDGSTKSPNPNFDCGLAAQNMYIAASSLGYGVKLVTSPSMTLNGANHDAICARLGIDTSLQAVAVLLLGKADTDVETSATTRYSMEEKTVIVK